MGGIACDCLENPLGAVRLTFDRAVAAAAGDFDPSTFDHKDWGALDPFCNFLFLQNGLSQKDEMSSQLGEELPSLENQMKSNGFASNVNRCLVKIYDISDGDLKLNEVIEFIGVYTFDLELSVNDSDDPSLDLMEDAIVHLTPSQVPHLHGLVHRKLGFQDFLSGLYTPEN